jgi:hypothetical protein
MQESKTEIIEKGGSVLGVVNGGLKIKIKISDISKIWKKLKQSLKS